MNKKNFTLLLTMLMSMVGLRAFAHDIEAQYQGKTIYYKWINNNTELQVTFRGSYASQYTNYYSGDIYIPESVTYNGQTYNVTSIGDNAFDHCNNISSVRLPNTVKTIGSAAFMNCSNTYSIWADGVTEIGDMAFYGSGLQNYYSDDVLIKIGKQAFYNCAKLSELTIKSNVTDIDGCLVSGNTKLSVYSNNPKYSSYYDYCIYEKSSKKLVSANDLFPSSIPSYFTGIGAYAFNGVSLTTLTIPSNVTSIDDYAFYGCHINSVIISTGVKSIGNSAFRNSRLTSVVIPNSVTSIGSRAFDYCRSLTSVTIPNSVTSIGYRAFSSCSSLTSVTIPNSVTSIGEGAFDGCKSLNSVEISFPTISSDAFAGCSGLTSVIIHEGVTTISSGAFSSCTRLTSLELPSSLTSIASGAFYLDESLTSITVKRKTPITIDPNSFWNRANATLYVPAGCKSAYEAATYWKDFKETLIPQHYYKYNFLST